MYLRSEVKMSKYKAVDDAVKVADKQLSLLKEVTQNKSQSDSWETEATKRKRKRDKENCSWEEWERRKKEQENDEVSRKT